MGAARPRCFCNGEAGRIRMRLPARRDRALHPIPLRPRVRVGRTRRSAAGRGARPRRSPSAARHARRQRAAFRVVHERHADPGLAPRRRAALRLHESALLRGHADPPGRLVRQAPPRRLAAGGGRAVPRQRPTRGAIRGADRSPGERRDSGRRPAPLDERQILLPGSGGVPLPRRHRIGHHPANHPRGRNPPARKAIGPFSEARIARVDGGRRGPRLQ